MIETEAMVLVCDGTAPPGCCRLVMRVEWARIFDERTERMVRAAERSRAAMPTECPECQSDQIMPPFSGRVWECTACGWLWET